MPRARCVLGVSVVALLLMIPHSLSAAGSADANAPSVVEFTADAPVLIQAPDGIGARVLLTFPELRTVTGKPVVSARLLLPHIVVTERLILEVKTLARSWDPANVSWLYPWEVGGGDFSEELRGTYRVDPERDPARSVGFDVTAAIRAIADGDAPDNGFLLKPARNRSGGEIADREIPAEVAAALQRGARARLILTCASGS